MRGAADRPPAQDSAVPGLRIARVTHTRLPILTAVQPRESKPQQHLPPSMRDGRRRVGPRSAESVWQARSLDAKCGKPARGAETVTEAGSARRRASPAHRRRPRAVSGSAPPSPAHHRQRGDRLPPWRSAARPQAAPGPPTSAVRRGQRPLAVVAPPGCAGAQGTSHRPPRPVGLDGSYRPRRPTG